MSLQFRRGTYAQLQNVTPALGEPIFTTDTNALYVGDGVTAGGHLVGPGGGGSAFTGTIANLTVTNQLIAKTAAIDALYIGTNTQNFSELFSFNESGSLLINSPSDISLNPGSGNFVYIADYSKLIVDNISTNGGRPMTITGGSTITVTTPLLNIVGPLTGTTATFQNLNVLGTMTTVNVTTITVTQENVGTIKFQDSTQQTTAWTGNQSVSTNSNVTFSQLAINSALFFSSGNVNAAGSNQGSATQLTTDNVFVTGGTGGVVLPAATTGREVSVTNNTASPIVVYPASGASIENSSANVGVTLPAYATLGLIAKSSTNWWSVQPVYAAGPGITITQSANGNVTWSANTATFYLTSSTGLGAYNLALHHNSNYLSLGSSATIATLYDRLGNGVDMALLSNSPTFGNSPTQVLSNANGPITLQAGAANIALVPSGPTGKPTLYLPDGTYTLGTATNATFGTVMLNNTDFSISTWTGAVYLSKGNQVVSGGGLYRQVVTGLTETIGGFPVTYSQNQFGLTTATTSQLGGVKVDGSSITINNGVISATPYNISTVTNQALFTTSNVQFNGIVIGEGGPGSGGGLSFNEPGNDSGIYSNEDGQIDIYVNNNLAIQIDESGLEIKVDGGLTFYDGSSQYTAYLGTATNSTVGGVKVGSGINLGGDGTISVNPTPATFYLTSSTGLGAYSMALHHNSNYNSLGSSATIATLYDRLGNGIDLALVSNSPSLGSIPAMWLGNTNGTVVLAAGTATVAITSTGGTGSQSGIYFPDNTFQQTAYINAKTLYSKGKITGNTNPTTTSTYGILNMSTSSAGTSLGYVNDPNYWIGASNNRFTPTVAGMYQVTAQVTFNPTFNPSDTGTIGFAFYKNGSVTLAVVDQVNVYQQKTLTLTGMPFLNGTTDYIDFRALSGAISQTQTINAGNNQTAFNITLVR